MAATVDGDGYWLATATGSVLAFGDAKKEGDASSVPLAAPVVRLVAQPKGGGYWLVTAEGGVYAFGGAGDFGSLRPGQSLYPVVGMAATPDGGGYWLVTTHGQVYSFGDAHYYGSLGGTDLHNIPVIGMAVSADGQGYWLAQGGGEVIPYGDAPRLGGMRGHPPVVAIGATPDAKGYWLACGNGEVDVFGDAVYQGGNNKAVPRPPIAQLVPDPAAAGYWLLDTESFPVNFNGGSSHLVGASSWRKKIVSIATSQLGPSPDGGNFCNPYGPCEQWCALFATWVWEQAGVAIPRFAFVGNVYSWARHHTKVLAPAQRPSPGDLVLYGTGPADGLTSPHIGVVAQVWPDGFIDTVEGDAGPGPGNWTSVLVNGPYLPRQSFFANGMPIYGFAVP